MGKLHRSRVGIDSDEDLEVWHEWKWLELLQCSTVRVILQ